jgi:hypothetical protein
MNTVTITIEINPDRLASCSDEYLATLWHVAQVNPAQYGDHAAGELAERIGREIIRRWLTAAPVELWHHQGRHYYRSALSRLATYQPAGPAGSADWHRGVWTPKPVDPADDTDAGGA